MMQTHCRESTIIVYIYMDYIWLYSYICTDPECFKVIFWSSVWFWTFVHISKKRLLVGNISFLIRIEKCPKNDQIIINIYSIRYYITWDRDSSQDLEKVCHSNLSLRSLAHAGSHYKNEALCKNQKWLGAVKHAVNHTKKRWTAKQSSLFLMIIHNILLL